MIWVLCLTIAVLLIVVAFETACLLLILRSEYVAISGMMRDGSKRTANSRSNDSRLFQRPNELLYQSDSNFEVGDHF